MAVEGEDPGIFTTDALPSDARLLPTLTNAYLGTRVYRDILHVNGVYNGAVGETHRADPPSPVHVKMDVERADDLRETFCLDTRTGGLSNGTSGEDYWGHVFWDQDTWIYPNILLFYPEAACAILKYRIRTLEEHYTTHGNKDTRVQSFPGRVQQRAERSALRKFMEEEIHINGDVMLAFEQYFCITQDLKLFQQEGGWDVVQAITQYWCSRVVWNCEEENYHIVGVMPQMNIIALLKFAIDLGSQLHFVVPEEWKEIMKKLKVPLDKSRCYHPEYDGYCP
ncbi:hypothetical protein E2320_020872, partial [Naja naja]